MIQFSLFEGDLLNRLFLRLRLGDRQPHHIAGRVAVLILLTYVPMALLAWHEGLTLPRAPGENFFYDIAAYAIFFVGMPLFLIAENVIGGKTRGAAKRFANHGVVKELDVPQLEGLHSKLEQFRKMPVPEWICVITAFSMGFFTINTKRFDLVNTWHALGPEGFQTFTATGIWAMCIALPILNYLWLRWVWKIAIWTWYLYKVSRFHLHIVASHPDRTGGIGFLSEVQSRFGILILAYGVTNVAAVVIHQVTIEHLSMARWTVWLPIAGFVLGAPALFLTPLFLFTKQLFRCKKRAMELYEERAMERATAFEEKWLKACESGAVDTLASPELAGLNNLNNVFDRIEGMRVVPFDLRSILELFASAMGPILPILPYLDVLPKPVIEMIEQTLKLFHR